MDSKGVIDPINLLIGFVAIIGAVLVIIGKGDYGLVLLIISTLIEALSRIVK